MQKIRVKLCGYFVKGYKEEIKARLCNRFDIDIVENEPDFLISDCFNGDFLNYDCTRILVMGENITPDFNLFDYAIGFDHMSFGDRYLRVPYYAFQSEFDMAMEKHLREESDFLSRDRFCNFVFSDSALADDIRTSFFKELSRYKRVDSGGGLLNNIGYRVNDKLDFQKKYKFSIAFENSSKAGYVTEKILHAFAAGTIPIYWGAPDIKKDFNEKSFVNVHDFSSINEVIDRIIELDSDNDKYLKICKEPIYTEDSLVKYYYSNRDLLWAFIGDIFSRGPEDSRRIYNRKTGYNKEYTQIIRNGWKKRELMEKLHLNR